MSKKLLIGLLIFAVICIGLGFVLDSLATKESREMKLLDKYFQKIERAEKLFGEGDYDAALEEYAQALKYAESNEEIIKFNQAVICHRKAKVLYNEYARALNDPRATSAPDITEALELYKKPVEILNQLQQIENVKKFDWSCYIWDNKANSLVYQIYIYLYLKSQLEEKGTTQEDKEKAQEYWETAKALYAQALKDYYTAHDLARNLEDRMLVKQNIEFLTQESSQQAFEQGSDQGEGEPQEQRGLGFLAEGKETGEKGEKINVLPLPLEKKDKGKGAGKAEIKKGKK